MARSYDRPPGVTVTETTQASINPLIATPDQIALIGPSSGAVQVEEAIRLTTGTTAVEFKQVSKDDTNFSIVSVVDYDSASAQVSNEAYTSKSGYIAGSYTTAGGSGSTYTIARKTDVSKAKLQTQIASSGSVATINAIGDPTDFLSSGTLIIDKEQFTYTSITSNTEKQKVTFSDAAYGATGITVAIATNKTVTGNGTAFTANMVGQKLIVGSSVYTIDAHISPTQLTVAETVGSAVQATESWAIGPQFTLLFDGTSTATIIPGLTETATATNIQTALRALANVADADVAVTVVSGYYVIEFKQDLVGNVPLLVSNNAKAVVALVTTEGAFTFNNVTRAANNTSEASHSANTISGTTYSIKQGFVIPENRIVYVKYKYTPAKYFYPYTATANEFSNIEKRFGDAFKDDGVTVNSPLTLAAKIAIENGARDLILQPLFKSADPIEGLMPSRQQPTSAESITTSNVWDKSFRSLQSVENVGMIVPVIGQTDNYGFGSDGVTTPATVLNNSAQLSILTSLQGHIAFMDSEYDQLVIGIIGEDSTNSTTVTTTPDRTTLTSHLTALQSYSFNSKNYAERIVFIAQTDFRRPSTISSTTEVKLGGQYAAAAIAGKLASYEPQISLTRKTIAGFKSVEDTRTKRLKTVDSGAGFFVIEQNPIDGTVIVRHALTADNTSVAKSELNSVRAKHYMINSLRRTIDTQVIGQVIADETAPITIASTVGATLRTLQDDGVIVQFDSVQAQIDSIDPTQIGIRFNYRPAFAINYVNIKFSVDLTSGVTNLTTTDQANIGA